MTDFELLFFAAVAVFFGYKLWSVLGKTNGEESSRATEAAIFAEKQKIAIAAREDAKEKILDFAKEAEAEEEDLPEDLRGDVASIQSIDSSFTLAKFSEGAARVFEKVVEEFSAGKLKMLKGFLSSDVYGGFEEVVEERKNQGVKLHTTIISMEEPEIMDIELRGNICQIMVKFVSEQINFIKNKAGEIIDGSKSHIEHVTDVWTFERNLKSKEPSWIIVGTQEA